jgi:hypothetical protein
MKNKVRCRFQKSPTPVHTLTQIIQFHNTKSYFSKMNVNTILPPKTMSSSWSLFFWVSYKNKARIPLLLYANLILLDLIILIKLLFI